MGLSFHTVSACSRPSTGPHLGIVALAARLLGVYTCHQSCPASGVLGLHWLSAQDAGGSRGALMAAFVLNALVWLAIPVGWMLAYCAGPCVAEAGVLFNLANWLNLIFGLLAGVALVLQLRQKKTTG